MSVCSPFLGRWSRKVGQGECELRILLISFVFTKSFLSHEYEINFYVNRCKTVIEKRSLTLLLHFISTNLERYVDT